MSEKIISTICGLCGSNCGIRFKVKDGKIIDIDGNIEHPLNQGILCEKGKAAQHVVYSPDRLKHPLKRIGDDFEKISWEKAFEIMTNKFTDIKERYGPKALVLCKGSMVTQERKDAFEQFMMSYGSPNICNTGHLCFVSRQMGIESVYGTKSNPDYENAKCILIWGANPLDSREVGHTAYHGFIQIFAKAKKRLTKMIVIDPRLIDLGTEVDKWIRIRPGTDAALGLAMLHEIINENLYDKEFVDKWTIGFKELEKHIQAYSPEWAEKISWVPANQIREVANIYATTKPACILDGNGLDMHTNVFQTVRVIGILEAITGNLDVPGGDIFFPQPRLTPYGSSLSYTSERLSENKYPLFPDTSFPEVIDAIITGDPYQPKAMIVYNSNPLVTSPNSMKIKKALEKLEFLVVVDIFKTSTCELADLILPDASCFERVGFSVYSSLKGGFISPRQKVIEPIGESKPVFEVEYELAKRMGFDKDYPWRNSIEWINFILNPLNISFEDLINKNIAYVTSPVEYRTYIKNGFKTPSGKVELYSKKLKQLGYDPLPVYKEPEESPLSRPDLAKKYPLIGDTRKPSNYTHSQYHNIETLHNIHPNPIIRIHLSDASKRQIKDNEWVLLESPRGSIKVKSKITEEIPAGVVLVDYGWGNPWDDNNNINMLTTDAYRDIFSSATPNRNFLCEVKKINNIKKI